MAQSEATVWVQFAQVGFHHWPDAPAHRAYLAAPHRHQFQVEVSTSVKHDDREIGFHDLREEAMTLFRGLAVSKSHDFGPQSCESLARRLATRLACNYAQPFTVTVSEDGEAGATVTVNPE
jgi:hypothetical protein